MGKCTNYNMFFKFISEKKLDVIFEVGSRDCLDALTCSEKFNCKNTHVFECNPYLLDKCRENIKNNKYIKLCNKAVYDEEKSLSFIFPIKLPGPEDSWNGMGSLQGIVNNDYWSKTNHPFKNLNEKNSEFKKITVETIRLDTYCNLNNISKIDLLLIDVEGVPLKVIKSYGDKIKKVKYIISEVYYENIFEKGCDLFKDINNYLSEQKFKIVFDSRKNKFFGNCMWKNKEI